MTWVKICGLKTPEDVEAAVAAGADALGFTIARRSPRRIAPDAIRELAAGADVLTVLVTMDLPVHRVEALLEQTGVAALQPHGEHQAEAARVALDAGFRVVYPVHAVRPVMWEGLPSEVLPLIDAASPGSGSRFDWNLLGHPDREFVLAGGLTPENVRVSVQATGAWGVDVSSGVESAPGRKDPALIREFIHNAKSS